MESRERERKLPPAIKAYRTVNGINTFNEMLGLVEAALVMSLEGTNRATASEVLKRATEDFKVTSTAAVTGQTFSQLKIPTATTHGKSRFILDTDQLKGIKDRIVERIQELSRELDDILDEYRDITDRVKNLETKLNDVSKLYAREKELSQQIQELQNRPSQLLRLEQESARLKKEADRADSLRKECDELAKKIKILPMLEGRKVALQNSIKRYQDEEAQVRDGEARLGQYLEDLKNRHAWVTFVDLDFNIQRLKTELKEITDQINERRSLLQKILGTNKVR